MAKIEIEIQEQHWEQEEIERANDACARLAVQSNRDTERAWRLCFKGTTLETMIATMGAFTAKRADICHMIMCAAAHGYMDVHALLWEHLRTLDEAHGIIHPQRPERPAKLVAVDGGKSANGAPPTTGPAS